MVSVCGVALVVLVLEHRNELLLERLAEEARTDPLTGLLNRRGFDELAARELAHVARERRLDRARDARHRPLQADQRRVGTPGRATACWYTWPRCWRPVARVIDVAARLGGEEFAVLMPGSDEAGAEAFIERVRASLRPAARRPSGGADQRRLVATAEPPDLETMLEQVRPRAVRGQARRPRPHRGARRRRAAARRLIAGDSFRRTSAESLRAAEFGARRASMIRAGGQYPRTGVARQYGLTGPGAPADGPTRPGETFG